MVNIISYCPFNHSYPPILIRLAYLLSWSIIKLLLVISNLTKQTMPKKFILNVFKSGTLLWLFGYVLGIILFMLVPSQLVGWIIMPIGTLVTIWILNKKIVLNSLADSIFTSTTWTLIAIICDNLFLVRLFKPTDGYYKLDVYLYYLITFALPILIFKLRHPTKLLMLSRS